MKRSFAVAFGLLATFDVGGACAQSPPSLDILGVQLRMPRESAVQSLLSRQLPYAITNTVALTVKELGQSVWHISLNANKQDVVDSIDLDFAPPPTESTVLRISRSVCYDCSGQKRSLDAPSVENFLRSLAEKLKSSTPTVVEGRSQNAGTTIAETTVYVWTPAGQFLSSAELSRRLRYPARCINPPKLDQARTNVGIDFNLHLDDKDFKNTCGTVARIHWVQESGIITRFDMDFSDVAELFSALSKSAAIVDAQKGSQHQQELQRANQNRPKL
jgi:hypothetical protein